MVLRLILVSLVASMGLEAPSSQDVETWNRSGRAWIAARMDDFSRLTETKAAVIAESDASMLPEAEEMGGAVASLPAQPVDDLTFEVVMEGMAVRFGDEVEMARKEAEKATALVVAATPPAEAAVVADAVQTNPVGVESGQEDTFVEVEVPAQPVASAPTNAGQIHRLTKAVQLTRKAVEAWANLINVTEIAQGLDDVVLSR